MKFKQEIYNFNAMGVFIDFEKLLLSLYFLLS